MQIFYSLLLTDIIPKCTKKYKDTIKDHQNFIRNRKVHLLPKCLMMKKPNLANFNTYNIIQM